MADEREITCNIGDCTGCQGCVELAPDYFEWNEDMEKPVLVKSNVPADIAQEVISCCPGDCIEYEDE